MADGRFFNYFPTIPYDTFDDSLKHKVVTDIFKRVRATLEARQDYTIYYNYDIKDGETPDILSYKYYGQSYYYWVILLMNKQRDPFWDWPLTDRTFEKYISKKYGSTEIAMQTHSHWETVEVKALTTDDNFRIGDVLIPSGMITDSGFNAEGMYSYTPIHDGVPDGSNIQSFPAAQILKEQKMWDKEVDENEKKRSILLLRRALINEFVNEFEDLITIRR